MSDETVITDDVSRYGLRELHLVRGGKAVDREAVMERILKEEGVEVEIWEWKDEIGMQHLYAVWRWKMYGYPMWVSVVDKKAGILEAVGRAAANFERRNGEWPDAAIIRRNGEEIPVGVELREKGGELIGEVRIEIVESGLQTGVVAVFRKPVEEVVNAGGEGVEM